MSLAAHASETNKASGYHAVKNDSLTIQISRCDTHFGQFKEEKLMQLGYFFSGEEQKFRLSHTFGRRRVT